MKTVFTILIIYFSIYSSSAQPGTLDKSFGDTGLVIGQGYTGFSAGSVLQADGKIIIAGNSTDFQGFLIVRYNSDGSIDNSFGNNSIVTTSLNASPKAIGLQSDGKIIITGTISEAGFDIISVRYNKNGSVDSSFGVNGILISDFTEYDNANDMVTQPDDKIIIVGEVDNRENDQPKFVVARYLPDGNPDRSFGVNGKEFIVYQNQLIDNISIALQQDGKILLGSADGETNFFTERYLANGEKDSSFGIDGKGSCKFANIQYSIVNKIALAPDGKIVVGGSIQSSQDFIESIALARFDSTGIADTSFGTNGTVITKFDNGANSEIASVLIQPDKKIIGAGRKYIDYGNNKYSYFVLARYNENGSLDASFANNGIQTTSVGYFDDVSNALLQNNAKIILTGSTNVGENGGVSHYALARYNNDETTKQIIITKIRHWIQHHNGIEWDNVNGISSYVVQRSYDGVHFNSIARIHAGNTSNYTYEDASPLSSTNYYRVQTTSENGAVANSNVIAVTNSDIKISPNPATNNLHIQGLSSNTKLTVVDFTGNVKLQAVANNISYNLNIASLQTGNYLLKIETNGQVVTKQFVKE